MPNRPTKEFWKKVYPAVHKQYHNPEQAAAITAAEWKHLKPETKAHYELLRMKREKRF